MGKPSSVGGGAAVGGWKEVGRTTLGSNGQNITVSSIPDKRYYMIIGNVELTNGATGGGSRLGSSSIDTGSNYASRQSVDGGADSTSTSQTRQHVVGAYTGAPEFYITYISNLSTKEKLGLTWKNYGFTGVSNAPKRMESAHKWTNTSNPLDIVNYYQGGSDNFTSGDEVVVLGWDPDDTHTTNFWGELANVSSTSTISSIESGVFTSKKYLWVQAWCDTTTAANWAMRLGNTTLDTGSNYSNRRSINGAGDATATSQTKGHLEDSGGGLVGPMFLNAFIINNASNEKLCIFNTVFPSTAGAGTAPNRIEGVFKWANTSNQADILSVGTFSQTFTKSELRVWGSD